MLHVALLPAPARPQQTRCCSSLRIQPGRKREAGLTATYVSAAGSRIGRGTARNFFFCLLCGNDAGQGEGDKGREKRKREHIEVR